MKKLLTILSTFAVAASLLLGCKHQIVSNDNGVLSTNMTSGVVTVGGITIDPIATGNAARIAAKYGAIATINHDPNTRSYFQISSSAIAAMIVTGNYNPTNLSASLDALIDNKIVSNSISDALSIYQDFVGKLVANKLDAKSPYFLPVLSGLQLGLQDAVSLTVTVPSTNSSSTTIPNTIPSP